MNLNLLPSSPNQAACRHGFWAFNLPFQFCIHSRITCRCRDWCSL